MIDYTAARTAMVDCQVRPSDVTKYPIIDALLSVPRENYVPPAKRSIAYAGEHIELGGDRVLLDPRTFAKMLDAANITKQDLVLDLGCGHGYSTAVMARLAQAVVAVESDADMATEASNLLAEHHVDNAMVVNGPLAEGSAKHGPFDVIFIQGGVEEVPASLTDMLKVGGRMLVILQNGALGQCREGIKGTTGMSWRYAFDATAPLLAEFRKVATFQFA